tara:strand:- start:320 stop:1177 length:858 start_codon:yes stop_codon:yes gene_type:complete
MGSVMLTVQASNASDVSVSPGTLSFDNSSSSWQTAQTVTVSAVNDAVDDDNVTSTITVSVDTGNTADAKYDLVSADNLTVTTIDEDTAGLTVVESGSGTSATEGGNNDTFTVRLASRPIGSVLLTVQADNSTDVSVSPTTLSFDNGSSSWQTAQTVTVSAVNDTTEDGNVTSKITVLVDTDNTTDSKYDFVSSENLTVTTIDDDSLYVAITSGHCEGNSYNKITNASTCETAATSLGYTYSNKINDSSGQQRCFVSSSDNKAYYNQSNTGNININSQSSAYICAR